MAINFNNIPEGIRTPGVYTEVDNSRALQNLVQNPHKALIIGQMTATGSGIASTLYQITNDGLGDFYFGGGSITARMCNAFKSANPNMELWAIGLSDDVAAVAASGNINITGSATEDGTYYLLVAGEKCYVQINEGDSAVNIASAILEAVSAKASGLPVDAVSADSTIVGFTAKNAGEVGNSIDIRANYYTGQRTPDGLSMLITEPSGGTTDPDLDNVWSIAAVDEERFHHIAYPYTTAANLTSIEDELEDRFGPLNMRQGHGYTAYQGTQAACTVLGNSRNSPYNTIMGYNDSPSGPEIWAAVLAATAGAALNNDPARPLHYLELKGILAPSKASQFTRAERDTLLYDGIATYYVDSSGRVTIERCITTYQTNAVGISDPSYLDIQTLFTLGEIRDQYQIRMTNRYLVPRFKLANDNQHIEPGSYVTTPNDIKLEIINLFTQLSDRGLIENLNDFKDNLIVERDDADLNRVNVLLPPDLINQFRVLASVVQFIL